MKDSLSPFVKWAGGKGQLLDRLIARMPSEYNHYFEPFIGGGAMLLTLNPEQAMINDVNAQLVNAYRQLKQDAHAVVDAISTYEAIPCTKALYIDMRNKYNEKIEAGILDTECAALMIWINKHCFNGLYRVNSKGFFNVPYNNNVNGKSCDRDNLLGIGNYLKQNDVRILQGDFEAACEGVTTGDFVYFDSPYVPISDTANFTDYTKDGFSYEDHVRLSELFKELDKRGAYVMLSNHDVPLVHQLYEGFSIESTAVKRMINSDASKRDGKEVIITNYRKEK